MVEADRGAPLLGVGAIGLVLVVVLDVALSDRALFEEWEPVFSAPYLLRTAGLAVSSFLIVLGARLVVVEKLPAATPPPLSDPPSIRLATGASLLVAGAAALLLLVDPVLLSDLVREDRLVEWASALFAMIAAGFMAGAAWRRWRNREAVGVSWLTLIVLVGLGGTFLLLGLEEVSWFQRVLDVESPDAFINRNAQQELNLHNFATVATGNAFYGGSFVFCVAIPFLLVDRKLPARLAPLAPAMPSLAVLYSSAVAGAIVYLMWNVILIQLTFWMALAAMLLAGATGHIGGPGRYVAAAMVLIAAVFLIDGESMVRTWDDTEVRELVIPFNLLVYSLGVHRSSGLMPSVGGKPASCRTVPGG